jgi:hypothetical protein
MGFLLRTAFWFSLVLLVLPFDVGGAGNTDRAGPLETFLAAREAVADLSGLCERKPAVCEIGRSALNTVGLRAREAARIAYEMLDETVGEDRADAGEEGATVGEASATASKGDATVGEASAMGADTAVADREAVTGGIKRVLGDGETVATAP